MRPTDCVALASALTFLLGPTACGAFCGVSSRRKLDPVLLTSSTNYVNLTTKDLRTLCERVGVHGRARKPCRQSVEVAGVLVESAWAGVRQCQHLMRYERWNCSLGKTRRKIMRRVFRETAFLQALSSASVTHVVSRACAQGRLTHCSCGSVPSSSSSSYDDDADGGDDEEDHLRVWRWGGCGDNVLHGSRFAEKLFIGGRRAKARRRAASKGHVEGKSRASLGPSGSQDFKSRIDIHNALVGIMTVENTAQETCKCHGVSGSCSMKTCWIQLPSFYASARVIKQLYETATLAVTNNEARMKRVRAKRWWKKKRYSRAADDVEITEGIQYQEYRNSTHMMHPQEGRKEKAKSQAEENEWSKNNRKRTARDVVNNTGGSPRRSPKRSKSSRRLTIQRKSPETHVGDPRQMVYLDRSPNFCLKGKYGPGTRSRTCQKRDCESLCCGRGYDTSVAVLEESCRCRVVWCCHVQCHNCSRNAEIYTCK